MKIQSNHTEPVVLQPISTATTQAAQSTAQPVDQAQDSFSPSQRQKMLDALNSQPDVRPEVLARAKQLAADPNYPPSNVIESVAKSVINDSNLS